MKVKEREKAKTEKPKDKLDKVKEEQPDDADNDEEPDGNASQPEDGEPKHKERMSRDKPKEKLTAKPIRSLLVVEREPEKPLPLKEHAPSPQPEKVLYDNRIKRKNVLALNEKVAAIREYDKTPVYKRIGRMFHCSPDQIKRIVQQKDVIMKAWEQRTRRCQDARTLEMKVVRVSMLGKAVYDWIRRMMYYKDFMITDGLIQKMALQFKSAMGLQPFFPHQEWCNKFRHTYNIPENDSKLLNIGYTQGYSVQIKDIVKDVLNECTPDVVEGRDVDADADGEPHALDDDEDADVDVDGVGIGIGNDIGDTEQRDENDNNERDSKFVAPLRHERIRIKRSPAVIAATAGGKSSATVSTTNSTAAALMHSGAAAGNKVALRLKMPIHKLLTLPMPQNGMQQVLVATPITTVTPLKAAAIAPGTTATAAAAVGNAVGSSATPMTMTIIPLATIAPQSQSSPQSGATAVTLPGPDKQAGGLMPVPLKEIKQEIKEEPADVVEIKQEYISEDEGDYTMADGSDEPYAGGAYTAAETANGTVSPPTHASPSVSMASPPSTPRPDTDFENVTLAELRDLIHKQTSKGTASKTPCATPPAPEDCRPPRPQRQQSAASPAPAGANQGASFKPVKLPVAVLPTMPPLIRAPTPVEAAPSSPAATPSHLGTHPRRKRLKTENDNDELRPIETYTQARRYIKLLESFALMKENFRLIGLLTRADEVLRELDGYGNTDSD